MVLRRDVPVGEWQAITNALALETFGMDALRLNDREKRLLAQLRRKLLFAEDEQVRVYPYAQSLCQVTGFVRRDGSGHRLRGVYGIERSLDKLGLPFVDLYLIHWPTPARGLYLESWQALERFAEQGLTRSIGVSNFLPEHLDRVAAESATIPAVNQIELHPELQQRDVEERCLRAGIRVEAWSPIARGALVDTPEVDAIAAKYGKTVAQVTLRWHLDHGRIIIPRTVHKARMVENFALFDFALDPAEIAVLDALETGKRVGPNPATMNNA